MMPEPYPILDFDDNPQAILEPHPHALSESTPQRAVLCFFQEVIIRLEAEGVLGTIGHLRSEIGDHPFYLLEQDEHKTLVFHPGVGAPLAAGFLEELIALGLNRFIVCGGCGVLDAVHAAGTVMVLTSAVRDEGTSYHYLPPGQEARAHPEAIHALETACKSQAIPYRLGKSWTTDGIYRETVKKRALRISQGCEVVEMEASALFAVAEFRNVKLGQVVYGGDLVVPEGWDSRTWDKRTDVRESLFWLAVEACQLIS
jgi:uridine phosphorylase